jgi:hypothetical protein
VFATSVALAQQGDARGIIRKAIDAHGGEKLLLKYQAATSKFKGTMDYPGTKALISGETSLQRPDLMKVVMLMEVKGQKLQTSQGFNGKRFWMSALGKTTDVTDEKFLADVRDEQRIEGGAGLLTILEGPYTLTSLGEIKIKGKDAVGVRVTRKGSREYNLFFDKGTSLLVKIERKAAEPTTGKDFIQEKYFSNYKEQDGMQVPGRLELHKDGRPLMELDILELKHFERLDPSQFAPP